MSDYIEPTEEELNQTEENVKNHVQAEDNVECNTEFILTLILRKEKTRATEVMTRHFLDNNKVYTTRNDEKNELWIYKDGIYIPQGKTYIQEFCRSILGEAYTTNLCGQVVAKIEADTYINQEDFFINEDINKVPVENGILDLKTKILEPFTTDYRFFNKLPVIYDKSKQCESIIKFFESVLSSEEDISVMQELFGYLLYRDYKIEKAFMFSGDGRNGKGKTVELMKRFIGIENCSNITLQTLEKDSFSMSNLFNKLANLSADISKTALKETGNFKNLTGHDMVEASRKYLTTVKFVNYAKMIYCANELPITKDITTAFFNRWVLIDFKYTFLSQKEYDSLSEKTNIKVADTSIIDKISTTEELSGLLNWALEGLDRLLKNSDFSYSSSTEETKMRWLRKSSSFNAFVMDCVEESFENYIIKQDLKQAYIKYCRIHKIKPVADNSILYTLTTEFGVTDEQKTLETGKRIRCWEGIKLK